MAVKPGDFLLVNFTLKVKESGETVDTTYDAVAKDTHLHREDSTYGPRFIILGEGWLPKGLEDSLVGADIGKQTTVELPPDKGFGTRDPAKMRLVPLRRVRDKGIDPNIDAISFREVFKRKAPEAEMEEASKASAVETSKPDEQVGTKKETEKAQETPAQPARKRRAPAKKPASKGPTKRAMMGSESQR